jgi:streptogramin lyase
VLVLSCWLAGCHPGVEPAAPPAASSGQAGPPALAELHDASSAVPAVSFDLTRPLLNGVGQAQYGGAVVFGNPVVLDGTPALAWVVYRLPVWWSDTLTGITLDITGSTGPAFAGLSDWQRGAWQWQQLPMDAVGQARLRLPPHLLRTAPADNACYLVLVAQAGSVLRMRSGSLELQRHPPLGVAGPRTVVGAPVRIISSHGTLVSAEQGREYVYTFCNGSGGPAFVARFDPATGACQTWPIPSADETLYPGELGCDGQLYTALSPSGEWFRFDPATHTFHSLGKPALAEWTYGMCAADDGCVYGTGYRGLELVRYNPATGRFATLVARLDSANSYARTLLEWNGALYIGLGAECGGLLRYDLASGALSQVLPEQYRSGGWGGILALDQRSGLPVIRRRPADGSEHWLLMDAQHRFTEVDAAALDWTYGRLADGRQVWVEPLQSELRVVDASGAATGVPFDCGRSSAQIYTLTNGPGGLVYGSTYPASVFSLDPATQTLRNLGNLTGADGQAYALAGAGSLLYLAAYPRGNLSVYDPARPSALAVDGRASAGAGANPRSIGFLDNFQHRPVDLALGPDGLVYMAVIADYGGDTGSLSRCNPASGGFSCRQPYPGEDFTGVAVAQGRVYGLTERRLVSWNALAQAAVWTYQPVPPHAGTPTRLCADRNGNLVWADSGAGGKLYVYNPREQRLVAALSLAPDRAVTPSWNCLDCGPDGNVYFFTIGQADGVNEACLNVLDSSTYTITRLCSFARGVRLPAGFGWDGGALYYGLGGTVYKVELER